MDTMKCMCGSAVNPAALSAARQAHCEWCGRSLCVVGDNGDQKQIEHLGTLLEMVPACCHHDTDCPKRTVGSDCLCGLSDLLSVVEKFKKFRAREEEMGVKR